MSTVSGHPIRRALAAYQSVIELLKRPVADYWPISQPFGYDPAYPANGGWHWGIDYRTPIGTPGTVRESGRVIIAEANYPIGMPGILDGAWGTYLEVETSTALRYGYAHLSELYKQVGEWTEAGEICYLTGNTGIPNVTIFGAHLHEHKWRGGARVDPLEDSMTPEQRERLEYVRVVLNAWAEELQGQVDYWQSRPYPKTDSLPERQAAELRGLVNILTEVVQ